VKGIQKHETLGSRFSSNDLAVDNFTESGKSQAVSRATRGRTREVPSTIISSGQSENHLLASGDLGQSSESTNIKSSDCQGEVLSVDARHRARVSGTVHSRVVFVKKQQHRTEGGEYRERPSGPDRRQYAGGTLNFDDAEGYLDPQIQSLAPRTRERGNVGWLMRTPFLESKFPQALRQGPENQPCQKQMENASLCGWGPRENAALES
jgi:hypothetical protein